MLTEEKKQWFVVSKRITAYLAGELGVEEEQELESWLAKDAKNRELFDRICATETIRKKFICYREEDAEKAFQRFVGERKRLSIRRRIYSWSACAAVLMLGFGAWALLERGGNGETATLPVIARMIPEDSLAQRRPMLTLAGGEQMRILGNRLAFEETDKGQRVILEDSVLFMRQDSSSDFETGYNELVVPPMCDFNFVLSDGTKVWMNAASSLRYPAKFASDSRTVYASGEIYLEVVKDTSRPFYVVLDGMEIKVLGTCFNVRSYPNEAETKVTLAEGKVAAQIGSESYLLKPGNQLCLHEKFGAVNIRPVDVGDVLAWKRGYYVFKKSRLSEVASTLQNWYDVHIVMTNEHLLSIYYTGVVNKEEPIEVFLNRLEEVSGIKWAKNGNTVCIY